MTIYIYADVLAAKNFIMNFILLLLFARLLNIKAGYARLALSSAGGAVYQLIMLSLLINENVYIYYASSMAGAFVMLIIAYGVRSFTEQIKRYCIFLFMAFALNGILEFCIQTHRLILFAIICVPAAAAIIFFKRTVQTKKQIYSVHIYYKDKKYTCMAFYDTGNQLKNPFNNRAAAVMDKEAFVEFTGIEEFDADSMAENKICILPYKSAGCENGIIYGITADRLEIITGSKKQKNVIEDVPVGCVKNLISKDREYVMLLPGELPL